METSTIYFELKKEDVHFKLQIAYDLLSEKSCLTLSFPSIVTQSIIPNKLHLRLFNHDGFYSFSVIK